MSFSHIIGFDDAPFIRDHRGNVMIVGAVMSGPRLDGVVTGRVRRDGANATRQLAGLVSESRFSAHLQLVMLQGVALAGFNVVDVPALADQTGLPVLVIARREPDYQAIREALLQRVRGGSRKWTLIEQLGPMEPVAGVWVQRVGLTRDQAETLIRHTAIHGFVPEPLRMAHLIAGGVGTGQSRGRV